MAETFCFQWKLRCCLFEIRNQGGFRGKRCKFCTFLKKVQISRILPWCRHNSTHPMDFGLRITKKCNPFQAEYYETFSFLQWKQIKFFNANASAKKNFTSFFCKLWKANNLLRTFFFLATKILEMISKSTKKDQNENSASMIQGCRRRSSWWQIFPGTMFQDRHRRSQAAGEPEKVWFYQRISFAKTELFKKINICHFFFKKDATKTVVHLTVWSRYFMFFKQIWFQHVYMMHSMEQFHV